MVSNIPQRDDDILQKKSRRSFFRLRSLSFNFEIVFFGMFKYLVWGRFAFLVKVVLNKRPSRQRAPPADNHLNLRAYNYISYQIIEKILNWVCFHLP